MTKQATNIGNWYAGRKLTEIEREAIKQGDIGTLDLDQVVVLNHVDLANTASVTKKTVVDGDPNAYPDSDYLILHCKDEFTLSTEAPTVVIRRTSAE